MKKAYVKIKKTIYDLYDTEGKVMETFDEKQAMDWKKKGEEKRTINGHKSKWIKARKLELLKEV